MKPVTRIIAFALALLALPSIAKAWTVPDETLNYSVRFKWGFIDANVGIATLTTYNIPGENRFTATLTGKSIDLFGHYYAASDTITGSIMSGPLQPVNTETLGEERGQFAIETITYNSDGPSKDGPVIEHIPDGKVIRSRVSNYGSGLTIDLLSVFYYMRQINYANYTPGQTFRINLTNGTQVENLNITYVGKDPANMGSTVEDAFHITLTFTAQNSSACDSMDVWISTDDARQPLIINGSMSVGRMECRLIN